MSHETLLISYLLCPKSFRTLSQNLVKIAGVEQLYGFMTLGFPVGSYPTYPDVYALRSQLNIHFKLQQQKPVQKAQGYFLNTQHHPQNHHLKSSLVCSLSHIFSFFIFHPNVVMMKYQ